MTHLISRNTTRRPRVFHTLFSTLLLLPILATLSACDSSVDNDAAAMAKPVLTVTVVTPATRNVSDVITANGAIAAWQEAIIGPEVNGLRVEKLLVEEGDTVRKGQPLAEFARETVMNTYLLATAELNEAKALALNAQADGRRARKLRGTGTLSEQDIHKLLTQELAAQARLESAKARVAAQKIHLDQTVLRAPDDGIIASRQATIGSVPTQGTEMFRLIRQGRFEWRAELPAQQLEKIATGQRAVITSPGGRTWEGVVRLTAPVVDAASRRGIAYVDITPSEVNSVSSVRPGTYVSGMIMVGDRQGMTVPQSAIVARDGYHQVFTVDDNNRVSSVKVSVGRLIGDQQVILSGLQGTEHIVASGGVFLNTGDSVQLTRTPDSSDRSEQQQEGYP